LQACSSHILNNDGPRFSARPGYAIEDLNPRLLWLCSTFANNNVLSITTTIWICRVDENRQAKDSSAKYSSLLERQSSCHPFFRFCSACVHHHSFQIVIFWVLCCSLVERACKNPVTLFSQSFNWPHSFLSNLLPRPIYLTAILVQSLSLPSHLVVVLSVTGAER
jgi:hypothetical protein